MRNVELTEDLIKWIEWAKQKADWYDPLVNKKDNSLMIMIKPTFSVILLKSGNENIFVLMSRIAQFIPPSFYFGIFLS